MENVDTNTKQSSEEKNQELTDYFPIDVLIQNPGFQFVARNIFKYLELQDFSNGRLVCKAWRAFIDYDKRLANVQIEQVN